MRVDEVIPELLEGLSRHPCAVLEAPTGAGKTTRVPPALLDAGFGGVLVLEPRRVAARAAARRVASERGSALGGEVGYQVRFDRRIGRDTRLAYVTEGVLLRRLQDDPFLEGVQCVVLDEFHERSLDVDLALAMLRRIQLDVREDLRLVVMSATLEGRAVAAYMGACPVVRSEGRTFPVEVSYVPGLPRERLEEHVARAVRAAGSEAEGSLLVFLPGVGEIRRVHERLAGWAQAAGRDACELYGNLAPEAQDAVLEPSPKPKLILATNVAETSITIEGVTTVVDSGLARILRYDAGVGLDRLEVAPVSRASTEQRRGRAGRTGPGRCVRLWSELEHRARRPHEVPAIQRVDLCGAVLQLACFGERDLTGFPWFAPPPEEALEGALTLLRRLGALDRGGVTSLGQAMGRLPVHPRVARLLIEARDRGIARRAAIAAALLSDRDPFARGSEASPWRDASESDLLDRVRALEAFERSGVTEHGLSRRAARAVLRAAGQYERLLDDAGTPRRAEGGSGSDAFLRAVFAGYPDRLARRRPKDPARGVLIGGRGVRMSRASAVSEAELFVCVDLDAGGAESYVRMASAVERAWLPTGRLEERVLTSFDERRLRVTAVKQTTFEGLVLDEVEHPVTDATEAEEVLCDAARRDLDRALPLAEEPVAGLLARLRCLRQWMPELQLPAFEREEWLELLPSLAAGCRSFADLAQAPLADVVRGRLSHAQRSALAREAPERVTVPSGSQVRLVYEPGRAPVLAVRIQEVFGLRETPRVGGGRVAVLLHLLAPNGRPEQVTDDLESFWDCTYARVRKELRRRYPRHAWPEDPRAASPEHRPGRKR